jgi:very-short-patch-repair endonuclease
VNSILFAVALLVLVFAALVVLKQRGTLGAANAEWPFYAKKPLTQPEQVLYHRLVAALPECIVLAQVQLSRVLGVKKGFKFNEWNNRINRMSLDYVVCLKDATVVAAVELDDKSHERAERIEADAKKEKALSAAGITLLRWKVGALPDEASIRETFTQANPPAQQPSISVPPLAQSSAAVVVKR